MNATTVLVVDDELNMRESLKDILELEKYRVLVSDCGDNALEKVREKDISIVITDARMPGMNGFELLREIKKVKPDLPVIMITAYATPRLAVEAMKQGATDYVSKPFDPDEILIIVKKIVDHQRLIHENIQLKGRLAKDFDIANIIGESRQIKEITELIRKVAPAPSNVLIEGESGTGKELVAKALHFLSERKHKPFVTVNCAAIPETLLESELFGYKKGAFTDAHKDKKGRFEEADGGTLFLDEIGDMPMSLQAKILRVIQDKEFRKIGDEKSTVVDTRIIAATNKDIADAIREGNFRKDLYFRINVININIPLLRDRREDIPLLIEHFMRRYNTAMGKQVRSIDTEAVEFLQKYAWPGNIRELENLIERLIILCPHDVINLDQVKKNILVTYEKQDGLEKFLDGETGFKEAVDEFQKLIIKNAIEKANGQIQKAADLLGISRHALRYQMNKLGIATHEQD